MTRGARGDLGRALHEAEAALAIADRIGHQQWSVAAKVAVGAAWSELLDPTRAADALAEALATARFSGFRFWITMIAATLASVQIAAGDLTRAGATLRTVSLPQAAAQFLSHRQYWFASAELALASSEPDRALEIVDTMVAKLAPTPAGGGISPLLKLRGDALGRLGRRAEARLAYQSAREQAAMFGFRSLLWRIDIARGELALADGRTAETTEAFQSARAVIIELAATIDDLPQREQFRKRASARLPAVQPSEQPGSSPMLLSPRELDVLRLIIEGKSDREIATALFISPRTVMRHVTSILDKLGVASRAAAAAAAIRQGMI
jgi:ATP/maltotriose-dependent transcriptional regulator MalT